MFTMTLALIYYLNFKYGWSQDPQLRDVEREVRDRDYFYLWSFSAWGVWTAIGFTFLWEQVARALGKREIPAQGLPARPGQVKGWPSARAFRLATPILILALVPLVSNWTAASRANHRFTEQWARDSLNSLEPYAILVTTGDNDTFPLWYAQEVEGVRRDVTVAVKTYLDTDWYVRQMIRRPVETYDAAKGPPIYRDKQWKKPSGPPLKLTFAEADAIPEYIELRQPQIFRHGEIRLQIPPGYLIRDQLVFLRLIKDALPERPIYLTSGALSGLGLEPYLLTQGFVQKLVDYPLSDTRDTPRIAGLFIDLNRTKTLWDEVYQAPEALIREGDWVDRPSFGIPYLYAFTGMVLAEGLARRGDQSSADSVMNRVRGIVKAARLEELLSGA
jgi:hypothetical protein